MMVDRRTIGSSGRWGHYGYPESTALQAPTPLSRVVRARRCFVDPNSEPQPWVRWQIGKNKTSRPEGAGGGGEHPKVARRQVRRRTRARTRKQIIPDTMTAPAARVKPPSVIV